MDFSSFLNLLASTPLVETESILFLRFVQASWSLLVHLSHRSRVPHFLWTLWSIQISLHPGLGIKSIACRLSGRPNRFKTLQLIHTATNKLTVFASLVFYHSTSYGLRCSGSGHWHVRRRGRRLNLASALASAFDLYIFLHLTSLCKVCSAAWKARRVTWKASPSRLAWVSLMSGIKLSPCWGW